MLDCQNCSLSTLPRLVYITVELCCASAKTFRLFPMWWHTCTSKTREMLSFFAKRCGTTVFSERKLTFTFAICYRPSVCLSFVCLSVCNVRAPYSAGWTFRQYFYTFGTVAIHWHSMKFSRRSSQGNPSVEGFKLKRNSEIQQFLTYRML